MTSKQGTNPEDKSKIQIGISSQIQDIPNSLD